MHHTYMHQGQGSKAKDIYIIHACIRIMYKCMHHVSYIYASWPRVSGSRIYASYILLLESPCSFVRPSVGHQKVPHHRYMHHTYMHASGSRSRIIDMCIIHTCIRVKVQDHRYVHHTHIDQSQGSRIIDMCIIHTCSIVKDRGT